MSESRRWWQRVLMRYILLTQIIVLMLLIGCRAQLKNDMDRFQREWAELVATVADDTAGQPTGTAHQKDYDAECVARVLYGIREYDLSDNAKTAVIEVIENRKADTACEFRTVNSIVDVCEQPNQWQGYVSGGSYLKEDYELALEVLYDSSDARTIPEGCFFLIVNTGEVVVRTEWDGGNEWSVR